MTHSARSVKGLVALITGAASGMGRATAELFAAEGALVAVTDYAGDGAMAVAQGIVAAGGNAHGWALDVSDPARIATVVTEIVGRFGGDRYRRQQRRHGWICGH